MRQNLRLAFVAVALVWALPATPQSLPDGVQKLTSIEGITEYSFPNGLHVLLFPDISKPKLTVNMTYQIGRAHVCTPVT